MNQIIKDFGKGLKQLGEETAEKLVENTGKIAESIITAKELLGDIKPMSDNEIDQKRAEDERKKQEEMSRLRQGYGGQAGRNLESEIEQIRHQKQREEEEKETIEMENIKRQREQERQQQMANAEIMTPPKHQKDKGGNKRKTQQPDESQMSQTAEYKGKID